MSRDTMRNPASRRGVCVGALVAAGGLSFLTMLTLRDKTLPILDGANLIFHEAGHLILSWAPTLLTVFGGTLFQLGVPLVCMVAFWREGAMLSALAAFWWFGQNLVNVSVYVSDARAQVLPLLGGDGAGHDWAYLLGRAGLLEYDTVIGGVLLVLGATVMLYALLSIVRQGCSRETSRSPRDFDDHDTYGRHGSRYRFERGSLPERMPR